jgi:DNA-binding MarR family transcriptional regulator
MRKASAVRRHGEGEEIARKRSPSQRDRALPELDRVIHERMRLAIVSALAANESLSFNDLKKLLGATDGNLSVHARKLEDAGYVALSKSFENRMPRTEYRLTPAGRRAFERYLRHLEALVRGALRP